MARIEPRHFNPHFICPSTQPSQSHRTQLGPLSKWLTGITVPIASKGKASTWVEFSGLSEHEILKRKAEILDEACSICSKYWEGKAMDSFPVCVECIKSLGEGQTNDHEVLKTMANSSAQKVRGDPQLTKWRSEYQFFVRHLTRKTYQIEFVKCTRLDCNHSSKQGIQAVNFFVFFTRTWWNGTNP